MSESTPERTPPVVHPAEAAHPNAHSAVQSVPNAVEGGIIQAQRILLVSAEPWARNVLSLVSRCSQRKLEVNHAINGAQGLYYMSQSIHTGAPYQLLVLTTPLAELSAAACVEALRSIERGLNRPPYPCLICSPEDSYSALIAKHPQTLHLSVPNSPQAASIVAAGILQMIHTLQAYQVSAETSRKLADQLSLSTLNIALGGQS